MYTLQNTIYGHCYTSLSSLELHYAHYDHHCGQWNTVLVIHEHKLFFSIFMDAIVVIAI